MASPDLVNDTLHEVDGGGDRLLGSSREALWRAKADANRRL